MKKNIAKAKNIGAKKYCREKNGFKGEHFTDQSVALKEYFFVDATPRHNIF